MLGRRARAAADARHARPKTQPRSHRSSFLCFFPARARRTVTRASLPHRRFSKKSVEGDEETRIRRSIGVDVARAARIVGNRREARTRDATRMGQGRSAVRRGERLHRRLFREHDRRNLRAHGQFHQVVGTGCLTDEERGFVQERRGDE